MTFVCRNPDDEAFDLTCGPKEEGYALDALVSDLREGDEITWAELRERMDLISDDFSDWQGIPLPIPDYELILQKYHPMHDKLDAYNAVFHSRSEPEIEIAVGGPASAEPTLTEDSTLEEIQEFVCSTVQVREDEWIRNRFYSKRVQATILIYQRGDKVFHAKIQKSSDRCIDRFTLALNTMGVIDAWDLKAEYTARTKLMDLISMHQFRMYELMGAFVEYSPRSRLTYIFRKGRPTVVLSDRWREGHKIDRVRMLAVLCMHPIGYYANTWAGCMTPTDDVIAHLVFMRGDEAGFGAKQINTTPVHPKPDSRKGKQP